MSSVHANRPVLIDAANWLTSIRRKWQYRRAYNHAFAELNALSGIELADLGLSRSMISRLAHEKARRAVSG